MSRSLRGLDWVNFFAAGVQTGFGPFITVYLTMHHWTGLAIGSMLSLGTTVAMISQIPAGALVDSMASKRLAGTFGLLAIGASALMFVFAPTEFGVGVAEILHGFASCMLNPAIAALSLSLVYRPVLGERLGRNVRFSSIGNGAAAAAMGAAGFYLPGASVFLLTAALTLPALAALLSISPADRVQEDGPPRATELPSWRELRALVLDRRLLAFMFCLVFFQMADAAMLPFVGRKITGEAGNLATPLVACALVLPQLVVAVLSPAVGRAAEIRGRRLVLLFGFAALPVRGVLFALVNWPIPLVLIQSLDGIGAAVIGVLLPLIAADISRQRGHFNLTMGAIGVAVGAGAAASTTLAGAIDDGFGDRAALLALAGVGLLATLILWFVMPESTEPGGKQGKVSFLKKRTKKLLLIKRVTLVLNHKAGTLLGDAQGASRLGDALTTAGFDIIETPQGALPERLRHARQADPDMVVVAGGDGTVACAAQALAGSGIALGIIPQGTANLLAKDLGIPASDPQEAVAILSSGAPRDIDVAEIDGQAFLCAAMFGSPARLGHHREEGRRHGNGIIGWFHFVRALARAARRHRARRLTVTIDGENHRIRTPSLTVVVNALDDSTGRLFGRSRLDGGMLSVYATHHRSLASFLRLAVNTLRGRFTSDPALTMLQGRTVRIDSADAALRVLVDGEERVLPTPVSIRISEQKLTVMAPA